MVMAVATGYLSYFAGAGFLGILARSACSLATVGLIGWVMTLLVEQGSLQTGGLAPGRSESLVDLVAGGQTSASRGERRPPEKAEEVAVPANPEVEVPDGPVETGEIAAVAE